MPQRVVILGSTGSIGRNTIDVIQGLGQEFQVEALAAGSRWELLAEQVERCRPAAAAISDPSCEAQLRARVNGLAEILTGPQSLCELVLRPGCNFVVSAIVGMAGLQATLAAIRSGRDVGLANKEAIVAAGPVIVPEARRSGSRILPIDSEHSAIFQALRAGERQEVRCVYLTASGGPFRTWTRERIESAMLEDALAHPTWDMGPKITIDSATMMNKAMEIIEAAWLFDLDPADIQVLIHPESIVHSMVEFCDGSIIAQMGSPDMRTPIQYALSYPDRLPGRSERLDVTSLRRLNFEPPDFDRFPALQLGYETARRGGTAGAAMNGANEEAVAAFRAGRLRFCEIVGVVEDVTRRHPFVSAPTLDDVQRVDAWARNEVRECLQV